MRASVVYSITTGCEIPATPDGGCLCCVLRTDFYSSQGELLQVIEFSRKSVTGNSKEIMVVLAIVTCFGLVAAGYVWRRAPRRRDNAAQADHQVHHHPHECGASRLTHADVDSGEGSAHVSPLCGGISSGCRSTLRRRLCSAVVRKSLPRAR